MALVLRKAVLPRNVSLLKCMKGRPVATAANKKNPAPLTTAVSSRRTKENMLQLLGHLKIDQRKQLQPARSRRGLRSVPPIRCCVSCPSLGSQPSKLCVRQRHFSLPRTRPVFVSVRSSASPYFLSFASCLLHPSTTQIASKRAYSKPCGCGCPCPFPCGPSGCQKGCGCLPPPCNTPPRCIQYMTGYYYYPYGFWFCGPYHVTGTCSPVGPCGNAAPCGPCCGRPSPAPCCICPMATAVVTPNAVPSKIEPKTNIITATQPSFPAKDLPPQTLPRTGLAKFFPFNTSPTPNSAIPQVKDTKKTPPSIPPMTSSVCPYSTQSPCHKEASIDESDVSYGRADSSTETHMYTHKCVKNNSFPSPRLCKVSPSAFNQSIADYYGRIRKAKRSATHYKRSHNHPRESCPILEKPRVMLSREQRDRPQIQPGAFDYSSVPNYKNPHPQAQTIDFKAYES